MEFIVEGLKIDSQVRPTLAIPEFFPPDTADMAVLKDAALMAINVDALNGGAHSTLASVYEDQGEQSIFASIAAAVTINVDPRLWVELLRQSLVDTSLGQEARAAIGQDAMLCAWKYFGPSFADVILDEELICDDELREELLGFFEMLRPTSPPFEMRQHSEEGLGYESFFIPTDSRATGTT
jgi:hypothetical protein